MLIYINQIFIIFYIKDIKSKIWILENGRFKLRLVISYIIISTRQLVIVRVIVKLTILLLFDNK